MPIFLYTILSTLSIFRPHLTSIFLCLTLVYGNDYLLFILCYQNKFIIGFISGLSISTVASDSVAIWKFIVLLFKSPFAFVLIVLYFQNKNPYKINSGVISEARLPAVYRAHHNARILCVMEHPTLKIRQNASFLLDVQCK